MANMGNRGKFSERLKKIRRDRLKKKEDVVNINNNKGEKEKKGDGYLINLLLVPVALVSGFFSFDKNVKNKKSIKKNQKKLINKKTSTMIVDNNSIEINKNNLGNKKIKNINKNNKINVDNNTNNQIINNNTVVLDKDNVSKKDLLNVEKLERDILSLIKSILIKNINELELLYTDLYILSEINKDDMYLKECQNKINDIKKLLSKIKTLKEKYNYLKDNDQFEYLYEYHDGVLYEKISTLKEICDKNTISDLIDSYKLLDEYKYLYLEIDKLQNDTIKYDDYKKEKVEELRNRDIDFEKFKEKLIDVGAINQRYENFVKEQNFVLKNLDDKISNISSSISKNYRLVGFSNLLTNSFRYFGLLLLSPLRGLIPNIAIHTMATRTTVNNLYRNLHWEEEERIYYEAIDYSDIINTAINNIDDISNLVDNTLLDITKLKEEFTLKFSNYENEFSEYRDVYKKLNKMENSILNNKVKLNIMKDKFNSDKKINSDKMKKVKKFNDNV